MSDDKVTALAAGITSYMASEDVVVNGWKPEQIAKLAARTLSADTESLATLSFQPEAYETAASFLRLLTPSDRPELAAGARYVPAANGERGYSVHVVTRQGWKFDAEVRAVTEGDGDGQYKLVVWPWDDQTGRGDRNREITLDIYDELERIEVI